MTKLELIQWAYDNADRVKPKFDTELERDSFVSALKEHYRGVYNNVWGFSTLQQIAEHIYKMHQKGVS